MIYDLVREDPYLSDYDREQFLDDIVISNDFCRANAHVRKCKGSIAVDIEWHDQDPPYYQRITEIGVSFIDHYKHGNGNIQIIIAEHEHLRQKWVYRNEDRKYNFCHGETWTYSLDDAKSLVRGLLVEGYAIVGHGIENDLRILDLGIDYSNYHIFDTQNFLQRHYDTNNIGLRKAAAMWYSNIPSNEWHNAGNDAFWTMRIFKSMAYN